MARSTIIGLVVVLLVVKAVASLNHISTQWEERTKTITWQPKGTQAYEIITHNGTVEFAGQNDQTKAAELVARLRAWAGTKERAEQALDAIEVTTDGTNTETCQIGWRWRTAPESDWSARVDFTLRAPKNVNLKVTTRNGQVDVGNLTGDAKIRTQNGQIDVQASGPSLTAETNNGEIRARYSGQKLNLHTHNGRITADLSHGHAIEGEIATHNGVVQVRVGKGTSCELITKTSHGWCNWTGGKLGAGGGQLVATTHNGAVFIDRSEIDPE
jgi:hypothetical protein